MPLRDWILDTFFQQAVSRRIAQSTKVLDDAYWQQTAGQSTSTRPWFKVRAQLEEIDQAARENPLAQRIIGLTTDFVVGNRVVLSGPRYALDFWRHPLNDMERRIYRWCDELTRTGELFVVLSRNPADGMHYVREVPALQIDQIEIDADDLEREYRYHQLTADVEGRWWSAKLDRDAPQVMLHYGINKAVGDLRGTSDLAQVLTWLNRYTMWLEDRVRINRFKSAYLWHVKIENALPATLEAKRGQYARIPSSGSIIVTDAGESWEAIQPNIAADDAAQDGKALRLLIAAGSGIPLHFLGEGESATRATAREMGTATYRHFAHRQRVFAAIVEDVIRTACQRAGREEQPAIDVQFEAILNEDTRGDPAGSAAQSPMQRDAYPAAE